MSRPKAAVLIDGEHYVSVLQGAIEWAMRNLTDRDIVVAIFLGGTEKIGSPEDVKKALPIPVHFLKDPADADDIVKIAKEYGVEIVMDLSDEPILSYEKRFWIASAVLAAGMRYEGSDFAFGPLTMLNIAKKPVIKVMGLGKRVGKTAVSEFTAVTIKKLGKMPCVIKAGRGGPPEPRVVFGFELELTPQFLLSIADRGEHAASDYWEEALIGKIVTIGARRCGGGMAGKPFYTTEIEAVKKANELSQVDFIIIEGSGTTIPPIVSDANELVVSAYTPIEHITTYFGPLRVRLSDLVVLTMAEEHNLDKVEKLEKAVKEIKPSVKVTRVVFRPEPLGNIRGKRVFFASTAKKHDIEEVIVPYLERTYGCKVVYYSPHLSNRPKLREDLQKGLKDADVLLTELKAAAVDVATREALKLGKEVVYVNYVPKSVGGDVDIESGVKELVELAMKRFEDRRKHVVEC
ncbi:MAG: 2,3-diphosphoglycerate synthetase [Crenarchaeota archaeon]|nr:2,3-diphosphoglycerate synthetase [Thermoproteota archaeon]